jgi:L-asparaginase II
MQGLVELARVWRAETVESVHLGAAVVADAEGRVVMSWGDPGLVTYPRSSLKPFQAIPLVESGAADALGLTTQHIALACASHRAQDFHVALVRDWLGRLELEEGALVCGPALPQDEADLVAAVSGGGRRRVFHNCSGKHCGFLTVSRRIGGGLDYARRDHPAQRLFLDAFSELLGRDAAALPWGTDGCGLPALALPLRDMATACARHAAVRVAGAGRAEAIRRIHAAIAAHPDHVGGRDEPTSRLVRAAGGRLVMKGGAEGYCIAMLPADGLGIAIKVADGATRSKYGVLATILGRIGVLTPGDAAALIPRLEAPVLDSNGRAAGRTEIVLG